VQAIGGLLLVIRRRLIEAGQLLIGVRGTLVGTGDLLVRVGGGLVGIGQRLLRARFTRDVDRPGSCRGLRRVALHRSPLDKGAGRPRL
jgi:hypothetical protein